MGSILFANFNIIPTTSPVYDIIWDYAVPIAIPLLLLKADIRKIKKQKLGSILFANFNIIPTTSPVYDIIWDYAVPIAIPLLLLKADIRKIKKQKLQE